MKKVITLIISLVISSFVFSQLPNGGFEDWSATGSYDEPVSWGNLNSYTAWSGIYTITKGVTAPAAGAAYVKLMTRDIGGKIIPGVIVSGAVDTSSFLPSSGFAFTGRPEKLTGKWQYMGYGSDAASVSAWLTKWNQSLLRRDTIAQLNYSPSGMLHSWGSFSIPFTYNSSMNPDTAVIRISSSGPSPVKYSFIWVDDLAFEGNVMSIRDKDPSPSIGVYPNPAYNYTRISIQSRSTETITVILRDNLGNKVVENAYEVSPGQNIITLNLDQFRDKAGLYFLQIRQSGETITRKLVIRE